MVKQNTNLKKALEIISQNKEKAKKNTKKDNYAIRLPAMQAYLDATKEKQQEFLRVVKNEVDGESGVRILEKGLVVYVRLIETIKALGNLIEAEKIDYKMITGSTSAKKRGEVEDWFHDNPKNKIVFISDAGGASLNLNPTNELIMYTIPTSYRKFKQVIGRIARGFGIYTKFNIRMIMIKDTLDEYNKELIGSKSSIENELLSCDSIPITENRKYNLDVFRKVRKSLLWRQKKNKKK